MTREELEGALTLARFTVEHPEHAMLPSIITLSRALLAIAPVFEAACAYRDAELEGMTDGLIWAHGDLATAIDAARQQRREEG